MSGAFIDDCKENGIKQEFTARDSPRQNGVAEWLLRSVLDEFYVVHDGRHETPRLAWAEVSKAAAYNSNRLPAQANGGETPFFLACW